MKYIKLFSQHSNYEEYISATTLLPNVSHCVDNNEVHYNKIDFRLVPFTTFALEDTVFTLSIPGGVTTGDCRQIEYSIDEGKTWVTRTRTNTGATTITTPTIDAGSSVLWRGVGSALSKNRTESGSTKFSSTGRFIVNGNMASIFNKDDFATNPSIGDSAFPYFFKGNDKLISSENLFISASTIGNGACIAMFSECTNMVIGPKELPSPSLGNSAYTQMFMDCTNMEYGPKHLPASVIRSASYRQMFMGCSSLKETVSVLPFSLSQYVVSACTCMYSDCISLTSGPELPCDNIGASNTNCYCGMFSGCTNLVNVTKRLPSLEVGGHSYTAMFEDCTSLLTAPEILATTVHCDSFGYSETLWKMFKGCTSLVNTQKRMYFTSLSGTSACNSMFADCTSLVYPPELNITEIDRSSNSVLHSMFSGCTSLIEAPELPATSFGIFCYWGMFYGCTSLTKAPDLPATKLTKGCYGSMFKDCSSLTHIKAMCTSNASNALTDWVSGVSSTGTFVKNENATFWSTGVNGIPSNWTVTTASE